MQAEMYFVDAFADRPFAGNPAAVCLLDAPVEDAWMQAVAAEMNLSETAFLLAQPDGAWQLRWFTPSVEVDLCGHATLASSHVLWTELGGDASTLRFHTRSGLLTAERGDDGICLDFPADPPDPIAAPQGLDDMLGARVLSTARGRSKLLVLLDSARSVRELLPDHSGLASLPDSGVIVTAPGDGDGYDFVSRFFAPRLGVPEDPVTGSAHCVLGPYWAQRLGKMALQAYQASARGGAVGVQMKGDRVRLTGRATTTLKGHLYV